MCAMRHGSNRMCGINIDTFKLKNMFCKTEITTLRESDNTIFGMLIDSGEDLS
jgi:hypothetical protein